MMVRRSCAVYSIAVAACLAQSVDAQRRVQFTTAQGTWMSLDVAPDGRSIVFELLGDLYTLPIHGGSARAIVSGSAFQSQPRFSPDGAHLAFISDENGTDNVWISSADGTGSRRVTSVPRATILSLAWSADGSSIFATVVEGRVADLWRYDVATGAGTKVVPNANGPPSPLVSSPAPGPYSAHATGDGKSLYFTSVTPRPYGSRSGPTSSVMRRDLGAGRDEIVTLEEPIAMTPLPSPNGRWLLYAAPSRGRTGFRLRDLTTEAEHWLVYPLQRNELEARASRDLLPGFAFTPDGAAIIAAYGGQIHRITVATGADTVIPFSAEVTAELPPTLTSTHRIGSTAVTGRIVQQPAIASDGRVAFSVFARLYVSTGSSGVPTRLTSTAAPREFMPAWSPDGRWIAFVTWDSSGGDLFKVRATGGQPVRLSSMSAFWADPVWTPDGTRILALRAPTGSAHVQPIPVPTDAALVEVPASGGPFVTLMPAPGMRHPHFAAAASRIWLSSAAGLVSVDRNGGDRRIAVRLPRPPVVGGAPVGSDVRMSPDGKRIALLSGDRLWQFATPTRDAGAPPVLDTSSTTVLSRGSPSALAWSADGAAISWLTGAVIHTRGVAASAVERSASLVVQLPRSSPTGTIALRGAKAITMRGAEVLDSADIVVTNDRIVAIGARGTVPIPPGAHIVDVRGKTVMPGLVDIHAHWQLRRELLEPESPSTYANLAFGVTTIRDPQTTPDIFAYADLADIGATPSPRIFSTGPGLFVETDFKSLDDVRRTVARYRDDYGTWLIKSYMVGNRQQRRWVVRACRELGMLPTAEGGADAKMDITHALDGFSGNEHALPTAPLYDDVVQLFARSGITYTPTLLVSFGAALPIYRLLAAERPADDPRLQRFFPGGELFQRTATRLLAFPEEDYNDRETSAGAAAILRAGGHVAMGGHGEMQGLQAHWEMRLLAQGGMPAHDVLRTATINGATAIGLGDDLGSLEPGKLADLIILDRDPLMDIRNTSSVRQVMKNGVLYDAATLDRVWPVPAALPSPWWREGNARARAGGARSLDEHEVDRVAREEMERQRIPGLAVAVVRGEHVLLSKGYGLANIEHQVPVTAATMFQSGSLGKMFTAAGVLALVEDRRLALDSSVRKYLGDAPASWQPITLRHLLSHTSGIPDYTSDAMDYRRDYSDSALRSLAYALPLEFEAGTRWNYSNTGYVLLGIIITRVTGKPYWEFLRERVFTPAGMSSARVISEADIVPGRASGYRVVDGSFKHQEWVSPTLNTTADGSLLISLNDLVAWNAAVRSRRVLAPASWDQLFTAIRLNSGRTYPYGFGWFVDSLRGQRVLQHGGSWQGFRTQFTRFEGSDLTVIVLANSNTANPALIASRAATAVDSTLSPVSPPMVAIVDRDTAITRYVRDLLAKTARGELAVSDFEFVRATVVPRMSAAYARLLGPLGSLTRLELLAKGSEADDRTFVYRATYGEVRVLVNARFGPGGRLTGWQLSLAPE